MALLTLPMRFPHMRHRKLECFVDLGMFTADDMKHTCCDHGLVIMFQPFVGKWQQIIGVFASRGHVRGNLLAKIILEDIILSEKSGLFVDFVTSDGAVWNRSMWKQFGLSASSCKVKHPYDTSREIHFISDFPHLLKCVRNSLISTGFRLPQGEVRIEHIEAAWKCDRANISLKAMPKITKRYIRPNNSEKMRVNYTLHIFSDDVLKGIFCIK